MGVIGVGDTAPEFEATDQRGQPVALAEAIKSGPVVLYFYPKDFTFVCTREACAFRDMYVEFQQYGAEVIGVSVDDAETHERFSDRHQLPFPLVADNGAEIAKRYGVLHFFGLFPKRVTFVLDQRGVVRSVAHHEVSVRKHIEAVRQCLAELASESTAGHPPDES